MKVQLKIKEDLARKVTGSKLGTCEDFFTAESLLKSTPPLVICIHSLNSCVRYIRYLIICFTCERYKMSSIKKKSTRGMETFEKTLTSKYSFNDCGTPLCKGSANTLLHIGKTFTTFSGALFFNHRLLLDTV